MSNLNFIKDANGDSIKFIGTISKLIYSQKSNNMIGVNINKLTMIDSFYKEEYYNLITRIRKLYKYSIKKEDLLIFAPVYRNYELENTDKYNIGTQVTFTVSTKKDIKSPNINKEIFTAHNLQIYYSIENKNTNLVNSMNNGIVFEKKFIPVEKLCLGDDNLLKILNIINKKSDINDILKLQEEVNYLIEGYMKKTKMLEYELECKKIEEQKKLELEKSTDSLKQAINSMQTVCKNSLCLN